MNRLASLAVATLTTRIVENLSEKPPENYSTPIKTGWASSNWLIGIGSPASGPVGTKRAVTRGPQFDGISSMRLYSIRSKLAVYVTNEVPYIGELNLRGGRVVPPGWIERAVVKAVDDSEADLQAAGLG
jgi:hypothetical protein